jgi:hypothetical protein
MLLSQMKPSTSYLRHSEHIAGMPSEKEKHLTGSCYCLSVGISGLVYTCVQKQTEIFKQLANQHRGRPTATEHT